MVILLNHFKKYQRKILSLILVFGMLFSILFPNLSLDKVSKVYAAGTELQPETKYPSEDNSSNTTIYKWLSNSQLDIKGKTNNNSTFNDGFIVTYQYTDVRNNGFKFWYAVTNDQIATTSNLGTAGNGDPISFSGGNGGNGQIKNMFYLICLLTIQRMLTNI